jgi:hypothetical protein
VIALTLHTRATFGPEPVHTSSSAVGGATSEPPDAALALEPPDDAVLAPPSLGVEGVSAGFAHENVAKAKARSQERMG